MCKTAIMQPSSMLRKLLRAALPTIGVLAECDRSTANEVAALSHTVAIAKNGTILLDGEPAGSTRPAAATFRFHKIEELETKAAPLKRDAVLRFVSEPDASAIEYMSVLATLGQAGFSTIQIQTTSAVVTTAVPKGWRLKSFNARSDRDSENFESATRKASKGSRSCAEKSWCASRSGRTGAS